MARESQPTSHRNPCDLPTSVGKGRESAGYLHWTLPKLELQVAPRQHVCPILYLNGVVGPLEDKAVEWAEVTLQYVPVMAPVTFVSLCLWKQYKLLRPRASHCLCHGAIWPQGWSVTYGRRMDVHEPNWWVLLQSGPSITREPGALRWQVPGNLGKSLRLCSFSEVWGTLVLHTAFPGCPLVSGPGVIPMPASRESWLFSWQDSEAESRVTQSHRVSEWRLLFERNKIYLELAEMIVKKIKLWSTYHITHHFTLFYVF